MTALGFQSTPSARRATKEERLRANLSQISIHALREESDPDGGIWKLEAKKFQSTPSARRATDDVLVEFRDGSKFQSTPSARRATS